MGETAEAMLVDEPEAIQAAVGETPQVEGIATYTKINFEIVNDHQIQIAYLSPNLKKIREAVKQFGLDAPKVVGPGIRVFKETVRRGTGR